MHEFFSWCEATALGETIRGSKWLFPFIESFHLVALVIMGGVVLITHLRLCGWGLSGQPSAQLWKDTWPWFIWSTVVMLSSGILLFFSEAEKLYWHEAFWMKMTSMILALIFTSTVVRRMALKPDAEAPSLLTARLAVAFSLTLWTLVGIGGRWIGYS